jgi:RNA polymerase sigma factor (sigma-70 family)
MEIQGIRPALMAADGNNLKRRELEAQFERLLRDHGPSIARLASAYERDPSHRDDLVQEIALALWKALPGFRGDCSERTLVFRIAHNRAVTHVDRSRRSAAVDLDDAPPLADVRATPEIQASAGELRERLLEAVRELPVGFREAIVLLLEGMTHAEIGDVLGISEGNVAVRVTRARKILKERLGDLR